MANVGPQQKNRVFAGVVTKMHENFGFVDEDVFFQLSACENGIPKVGDRVIVEAQFNPGMPFKWNASRVQVDQQQLTQLQAAAHFNFQGGAMHAAQQSRAQQQHLYALQSQALGFAAAGHGGAGILGPAPVNVINSHMPQQRQQHMPGGKAHKRNPPPRSGGRDRRSSPRRTDVRNRNRDEAPRKKRSKTPPQRKLSSSPSAHRRSISTDKSSRRPAPRYMVQYAKYPLNRKASDVLHLRNLCTNLYIPSDFFGVDYKWQDCFPLQQPVSAERCKFHVLQKDVEPLVKLDDGILDPPDADHSWTARVMLMQLPGLNEFYKQCCCLAEDASENFLHPSRLYKFLVGYKGKKEPMAIGGMWSPSLDGLDPANNPLTLIKTAIRTCKALTGIDLSKCTKWYRILEIHYHRAAETRKGRSVPDRVETTVIFLPDVHSCMPTISDYATLRTSYLDKLDAYLDDEKKASEEHNDVATDKATEDDDMASNNADAPDDQIDQKVATENEPTPEVAGDATEEQNGVEASDVTMEEASETADDTSRVHIKLDVKTMKVGELRKELETRGLSSKGLKATLVTRLTEAIEKEEAEVESKEEEVEAEQEEDTAKEVPTAGEAKEAGGIEEQNEDETKKTEDDVQEAEGHSVEMGQKETKNEKPEEEKKSEKKEERKKIDPERLRRHYTLPDSHPVIPVHPSTTYKKGLFECSASSLSNLLGYRQDDNKESIFEISVFAEAFKEMLQRGFAFNIYQALANPLPDLEKEKEEKDLEEGEEGDKKRKMTSDEEEEPKAKKTKSESDKPEKEEEEKKTDQDDDDMDEETQEKNRSQSRDSNEGKKNTKSSKEESKNDKGRSKGSRHSSKVHVEKSVTVRKDLLLSFVYFDHTHCGYLKESDLNDIIHSIGLGLSRSQISRVTGRYVEQDGLHYRKLTDVPASQVQAFRDLLERANKKMDTNSLSQGNKGLLPTVNEVKAEAGSSDTPVLKTGHALYNGVVVDVGLLQEKLANSEQMRVELEASLETVKDELGSTGKHLSKAQKDHHALESEYESTKKKLNEAQANFKTSSDTKNEYEKTLKSIISSAETVLPKEEETAEEKK